MTFRNAIAATLLAAALSTSATVSMAQQSEGEQNEQVLVAGTIDCRYQLRPVESTICSTPILAAMDIQLITLYNVLNALVKANVGARMAAEQQAFLKSREACTDDVDCIGKSYANRIAELDKVLKDIASRGPY